MVEQRTSETYVGCVEEITRDSRGERKAILDVSRTDSAAKPFYVIEEDRITEVEAETKRQTILEQITVKP